MEYMFETEHLKVRKFKIEDAQCLYENHLEEEVKKWIPNESYADIEETQGAINFYVDCVNGGHLPYVLAVELKGTGELIGDTGVNEVEEKTNEVEIGYTICKKHSGKGYATELLNAMTKFIVSAFGINVLYGRVMRGNNASVRVLEKSGYVFVKEEFGAEDDPYGNGMLIYMQEY
ncbi:MAG: GNAT family N-acetyltransferase [Oscillospiraceae bacterium]|nr:GNAT family N-acetyltransferase [Oscillospiraceae bacterium]